MIVNILVWIARCDITCFGIVLFVKQGESSVGHVRRSLSHMMMMMIIIFKTSLNHYQ